MCRFLNVHNFSFKWITYLVVTTGIYTFLHWFLAVPLLYSHFYDCCNDKWPKNWIAWFLVVSFLSWLGVSVFIFSCWCCLRLCETKHLNESNVQLTGKNDLKSDLSKTPEINQKPVEFVSDNDLQILNRSPKKLKDKTDSSEIFALPEYDPRGSFTILQMNDLQPKAEAISGSDFPIPVEETRHYVQDESPEEKSSKTPKTPREIFFKDMIEAASNSESYFGFDPQEISERIFRKDADDDVQDGEGKQDLPPQ